MPSLLITGFDPFGGESTNPAWEAVRLLPDEIGPYRIHKLQIPTIFDTAASDMLAAAQAISPDAVICIGQAGGRKAITPEMVAINLRHARIADNAGRMPQDEPIVPDGPAAYFTTLPVRRMVSALEDAGIDGAVSYSAGAFVCNEVFYRAMHAFAGTSVRAGFIHVPFLPQQAAGKGDGVPSMALERIVEGILVCLGVL